MVEEEKKLKKEDEARMQEALSVERQTQPGDNPFARRRFAKMRNRPALDKQNSILQYSTVKKFPKKSDQQLMADLKIAMYLITSASSYNRVDLKPFNDLMEFVMPEVHVKCSRTFAK